MKTLYKNKGAKDNVDNYRGITILSCFGKLFTGVINVISKFINDHSALGEEQTGFRKGYSTLDNICTLKCLIDLYLSKHKRLYCCFVDYRKAFDSVDRVSMWKKLLNQNGNGNFVQIILNLYKGAKSCVKSNGYASELFNCSVGVRQGDNLSPLLFAMYLILNCSCHKHILGYRCSSV